MHNDSSSPNEEHQDDNIEPLRLDHFLQTISLTATGGQAKLLIQGGQVKVNGQIETRRRRKLSSGDQIEAVGKSFVVP